MTHPNDRAAAKLKEAAELARRVRLLLSEAAAALTADVSNLPRGEAHLALHRGASVNRAAASVATLLDTLWHVRLAIDGELVRQQRQNAYLPSADAGAPVTGGGVAGDGGRERAGRDGAP